MHFLHFSWFQEEAKLEAELRMKKEKNKMIPQKCLIDVKLGDAQMTYI